MKFLINEKNQVQCPQCGQWVDMVHNENTKHHDIYHCRRQWSVFITKEDLTNNGKGKEKGKENQVKRKK